MAQQFAEGGGSNLAAYLDYWIANIDRGLAHWSEFGLAVARVIGDPQSHRDLQNKEGQSYGPDAVDADFNDRRAAKETSIGRFQ